MTLSVSAHGLAPAASEGFKNAAAYEAHRPAYPVEAVQRLLERMRLADRQHAKIVELGAGTGKLTEALAGRHEAYEVLATEPHADMLRQLEAKGLRGVRTARAGAEELGEVVPDEEGWADGVVAGQCFHWFATDEALAEIHRVLKPGGVFGVIWNIDDYNKPKAWTASTSWAQHLNEWIHASADDGAKRFRDMEWRDVFDHHQQQLEQPRRFSVPLDDDDGARWTRWLGEGELWRRVNTLSHVAVLEGADRTAAERVFAGVMGMGDVRRNERGEVECHGRTYFAWTERM